MKSGPPRSWSPPLAAAAALFVLSLAVHWPATGNGFVEYDDDVYVTANARVQQGLTWENAAWAFRATEASNWHPLTWLSLLADTSLFGPGPRGFHATSVVLHALNAALVFWLLWRATAAFGPSLAVAALFAAHPLNVQSVAWVAERKNVLSTLFWLLAMLAYASWTRRPRGLAYAAVVAALGLSLLAKPMAVTLPFVLLLFDFWPLDRMRLGWRRLVAEKAPLLAMVAAVSLVTYVVQSRSGAVISTTRIPVAERLANAAWSYLAYLGKAVWPADLAVFYPYAPGGLPGWRVALAVAAILAVTVALFHFRERLRPQLVGWLWYLGTLVPVIGIVQVGSQAMADRYAYVPLLGIFIGVCWGVAALVDRGVVPGRVAGGLATAVVIALCVRTIQQTAVWRDSVTLFEHGIRVEPAAWVAHYNLGNIHERAGRYAEAEARYRDAIRWQPDFGRAHNGLGNTLDALGRRDEAIAAYRRALQVNPRLAEAYNNLGIAYLGQGRRQDGLDMLRAAVEARPDFAEAYVNLAIALRTDGRLDESLAAAERAVALQPDNGLAVFQRALTLLRRGDGPGVQRDLLRLRAIAPHLAARLVEGPPQGPGPR